MREESKDKFVKMFTITLVIGIFVGGLIFVWPTYIRSRSLLRQDAEMDQRIAEKRKEIDRVVDQHRRFQSDRDFVERIARQNNRVYPSELVFIFSDDK